MKIKKNGQLWEFIDRYVSWRSIRQFELYGGDICAVARMFLVATLKCAGLAALATIATMVMLTPFWTLYLIGAPLTEGDITFINIMSALGTVLWFGIIGTLAIRYVIFEGIAWICVGLHSFSGYLDKRPKKYVEPQEPSELEKVIKAYYEGLKGKYCVRVELDKS
jgi:hypothetical protein